MVAGLIIGAVALFYFKDPRQQKQDPTNSSTITYAEEDQLFHLQLQRLPQFIQARIDNWEYLRNGLSDLEDFFDFMLPTHATRHRSRRSGASISKNVCHWLESSPRSTKSPVLIRKSDLIGVIARTTAACAASSLRLSP